MILTSLSRRFVLTGTALLFTTDVSLQCSLLQLTQISVELYFFYQSHCFFSYYLSAYLFHGTKMRAIVRIIVSCLLTKIQTLSKSVYSKLSLMPVKI